MSWEINARGERFRFIVSYKGDETIAHLLRVGNFVRFNRSISNKNFPYGKRGEDMLFRTELLQFTHRVSYVDVVRSLEAFKLRPACAAEVLAFASQHPKALVPGREVVGIEDNWERWVVSVQKYDDGVIAHMRHIGRESWGQKFAFLGVPIEEERALA